MPVRGVKSQLRLKRKVQKEISPILKIGPPKFCLSAAFHPKVLRGAFVLPHRPLEEK